MYLIIHFIDDLLPQNNFLKRLLRYPLLHSNSTSLTDCRKDFTSKQKFSTTTVKRLSPWDLPCLRLPYPYVWGTYLYWVTKLARRWWCHPLNPCHIGTIHRYDVVAQQRRKCWRHLTLPNIPSILGFIGKLDTANPNATPDYTLPDTFDNIFARQLNRHVFVAQDWVETERAFLLIPGLLYNPETNREVDTSFNQYGKRLQPPAPAGNDNLSALSNFLYLHGDNSWLGKIVQIMNTYCSYFANSTTLAQCNQKCPPLPWS